MKHLSIYASWFALTVCACDGAVSPSSLPESMAGAGTPPTPAASGGGAGSSSGGLVATSGNGVGGNSLSGGGSAAQGLGGEGGETAGRNASGEGPGLEPPKSPGCGVSKVAGLTTRQLMVRGVARRYDIVVPEGYDANRPIAAIFGFHGDSGSSQVGRSIFGSYESLGGSRALYIYPQGNQENTENPGHSWSKEPDGVDVAFFDAMLEDVRTTHCISPTQIFVVGHSLGGVLSNLLNCVRGDVIRGAAISDTGQRTEATCVGKSAYFIQYRETDPLRNDSGISNTLLFAKRNGCDVATEVLPSGSFISCRSHLGCDAGAPVEACTRDGVHKSPDYAIRAMWDFLERLMP